MKTEDFLESYQIIYRTISNQSWILIIEKSTGTVVKKYGFDKGQTSNEEFEIFTGQSLDDLETEIYANQIANDFNIKK